MDTDSRIITLGLHQIHIQICLNKVVNRTIKWVNEQLFLFILLFFIYYIYYEQYLSYSFGGFLLMKSILMPKSTSQWPPKRAQTPPISHPLDYFRMIDSTGQIDWLSEVCLPSWPSRGIFLLIKKFSSKLSLICGNQSLSSDLLYCLLSFTQGLCMVLEASCKNDGGIIFNLVDNLLAGLLTMVRKVQIS